eukprot:TRINITY_DN66964_c9_g1_i1.p1 TRINITY_DN66964_c9_g1~~TRINITY_DN66964_c9_g1_i1.p1  ORF type:complete len:502 (+),score=295.60 TRINITY_DN66964_c9_g1_i1:155-1660(+)
MSGRRQPIVGNHDLKNKSKGKKKFNRKFATMRPGHPLAAAAAAAAASDGGFDDKNLAAAMAASSASSAASASSTAASSSSTAASTAKKDKKVKGPAGMDARMSGRAKYMHGTYPGRGQKAVIGRQSRSKRPRLPFGYTNPTQKTIVHQPRSSKKGSHAGVSASKRLSPKVSRRSSPGQRGVKKNLAATVTVQKVTVQYHVQNAEELQDVFGLINNASLAESGTQTGSRTPNSRRSKRKSRGSTPRGSGSSATSSGSASGNNSKRGSGSGGASGSGGGGDRSKRGSSGKGISSSGGGGGGDGASESGGVSTPRLREIERKVQEGRRQLVDMGVYIDDDDDSTTGSSGGGNRANSPYSLHEVYDDDTTEYDELYAMGQTTPRSTSGGRARSRERRSSDFVNRKRRSDVVAPFQRDDSSRSPSSILSIEDSYNDDSTSPNRVMFGARPPTQPDVISPRSDDNTTATIPISTTPTSGHLPPALSGAKSPPITSGGGAFRSKSHRN